MNRKLLTACACLVMLQAACNEYQDDPPPPPPTMPDLPATQYDVAGSWVGRTDQGRPISFEARPSGNVVKSKIALHHDCSGGVLVLNLSGFESKAAGDAFSSTITWRWDEEGGKSYVGTLTVAGSFTSDRSARGNFINSVTEKEADNLGVCGPSSGRWEATKSE